MYNTNDREYSSTSYRSLIGSRKELTWRTVWWYLSNVGEGWIGSRCSLSHFLPTPRRMRRYKSMPHHKNPNMSTRTGGLYGSIARMKAPQEARATLASAVPVRQLHIYKNRFSMCKKRISPKKNSTITNFPSANLGIG